MKNSFFLALIILIPFFPIMTNCMDIAPANTMDYMDSRIDQFHTMQLLNMFDNAANNKWDNFNRSLTYYNGPLNVTNPQGHTLVHVAVIGNQEESVSTLITKGACLTSSNLLTKPIVETPLHYAAYKGHTKIAQKLIEADTHKVTLNSNNSMYGNTPLHLAAWSDHREIVELLITAKASISARNQMGSTPIHTAAWKNSAASLKVLLSYDQQNATQSNGTGIGNTPLYLASKAGSRECLQLLITHLKVKLEPFQFINHLDQECAGDSSTAIQAAGGRKNMQCYWDLALVDGDYKAKLKSENKSYLSEEITGNNAVKKFLETIERTGKNNPPRYNGKDHGCNSCNHSYENNDVVIDLTACNHSFHTTCFQNHVVEKFILENQNTRGMQDLMKDKSAQEVHHAVLTNPMTQIDWESVRQCPHCSKNTFFNLAAKIGVFLKD